MVNVQVGGEEVYPVRTERAEQDANGSSHRLGGNRCGHALRKSRAERTGMQAVERDVTFTVSTAVRGNNGVGGEPDSERLMMQRLAEESCRDIRREEHPRRNVPPLRHSRTCPAIGNNGRNYHNICLPAPRSNARSGC